MNAKGTEWTVRLVVEAARTRSTKAETIAWTSTT
jgi:hypothetical protein